LNKVLRKKEKKFAAKFNDAIFGANSGVLRLTAAHSREPKFKIKKDLRLVPKVFLTASFACKTRNDRN